MSTARTRRGSEEIEMARRAAVAWLPRARDADYVRGAMVVYDWLLGRCVEAPASGRILAPTDDAILSEEHVADDATYRRPGAPELAQGYAVGVATALMWARGVEDEAAVPIEWFDG